MMSNKARIPAYFGETLVGYFFFESGEDARFVIDDKRFEKELLSLVRSQISRGLQISYIFSPIKIDINDVGSHK